MAFSYYNYTGDGTTTQYPVAFPYIRREHVLAAVAGSPATFTFVNSNTIQMTTAPANGAVVRVYRQTPLTAPLVDFTDGATLVAADLDTNARQSIYTQQELSDSQEEGLANVIPNGDKGDITTSVGGTVWAIDAGAVVEAKIGTGAVVEAKIGSGVVTEAKIGTGAVTETKVADGAVVAAKIGTGAVVEAKIGTGAVTENKIGAGAVTDGKLATGAVIEAKIADGAVVEAKIGTGAVTSAKIANGTIVPADLSTGAPSWDASGNLVAPGFISSNSGDVTGRSYLSGSSVAIQGSGNRIIYFFNNAGGATGVIYSEAATGYLRLSASSNELVVYPDPELGVGATYSRTSTTGGRIRMTTGNLVNFHWNNGFYYNIDNNSYVLINASASDANLKTVESQGVPGAIETVMALSPVRFSYRDDCPIFVSHEPRYGFIAQELQTVLPELVQEAGLPKRVPDSPDEEIEDPGTYLRYADDASKQLIAVLTAALQEAIGRIEALEGHLGLS